jgi:hypothetical protein
LTVGRRIALSAPVATKDGAMAEEDLPDHYRTGHTVEPGPFLLDLYRLLCMVLADKQLAKLSVKSPRTIGGLQGEYADTEITRILTSTAVILRILFDQNDKRLFKDLVAKKCGTLYPHHPKKKAENLNLREACNKLIHATRVNRDVVVPDAARNPDQDGLYRLPYFYLYGEKDRRAWRAPLSIIDFAKWSTAVLLLHGGY